MESLECYVCSSNWEHERICISRCGLCSNQRYFCLEDGRRSHLKLDHTFTPNKDDLAQFEEAIAKETGNGEGVVNCNSCNWDNNNTEEKKHESEDEDFDMKLKVEKFGQLIENEKGTIMMNAGGDTVINIISQCIKSPPGSLACGAYGALTIGAIELFYHFYRLGNGEICNKEFIRRTAKTIAVGTACTTANTIGFVQGSAIGAAIVGAAVGTVGTGAAPLIGGVIGSITSILWAGATADAVFDKLVPIFEKEEVLKERMLNDSLEMFGYDKSDIENKNIFNKKMLERKFKHLSKVYHPDKGGNERKFQILTGNLGLLVGIAENGLESFIKSKNINDTIEKKKQQKCIKLDANDTVSSYTSNGNVDSNSNWLYFWANDTFNKFTSLRGC